MKVRCKKVVSFYRGLKREQCKRNEKLDGYCYQHHPDEVKKRELHRSKRHDAIPFNMLHRY